MELSVATLRSLPPAIDSKTEERETATLEWEGELDVKREVVAFGSFNAGYLQAKVSSCRCFVCATVSDVLRCVGFHHGDVPAASGACVEAAGP